MQKHVTKRRAFRDNKNQNTQTETTRYTKNLLMNIMNKNGYF